jgi:hypothetical protein
MLFGVIKFIRLKLAERRRKKLEADGGGGGGGSGGGRWKFFRAQQPCIFSIDKEYQRKKTILHDIGNGCS